MPDSLADLVLRIALLPPVSRGAHLGGPRLQAERLAELWRTDGAVSLAQAFRLLDVPVIEGVLWRAFREIPNEIANPRFWVFPDFETLLLPLLREQAWREILAGRLVVEAVPVKGSRRRTLHPNDLQDLEPEPDWQGSRLLRVGGQRAFVEVEVQPMTTAAAPVRRWREPPSAEELKIAMKEIAKEYRAGATPPFMEIWGKLKGDDPELLARIADAIVKQDMDEAHNATWRESKARDVKDRFSEVTREVARKALKDYAPQLKGRPGYSSKGKSPK